MGKEKAGLYGFGAIGRSVLANWQRTPRDHVELDAVCLRPYQLDDARSEVGDDIALVTDIEELLDRKPDFVIEATGHAGAFGAAEAILDSGADLYLLSVGILADPRLLDRLLAKAEASGSVIRIPTGALAGFDGLKALREQGLEKVVYTSTKPPHAWIGTPAQDGRDLAGLSQSEIIFEGNAREAAQLYPRNANLAAAVALAGVGLDETIVRLVADPEAQGNNGAVLAEGPEGTLKLEMQGSASAKNPKSSSVVAMSVISSIINRYSKLVFD